MKCLLIINDEISYHVNCLKDKMIRIPESDPSHVSKKYYLVSNYSSCLSLNFSLATSFVPNQWKVTYIKLVHKKGNKYKP